MSKTLMMASFDLSELFYPFLLLFLLVNLYVFVSVQTGTARRIFSTK